MLLSVLISSWSAILIFALLVRSKYRWTRPPYATLAAFAIVGVLSTLPALVVNTFLGEYTSLWFMSDDPVKSSLGFMIGAGFGEELWKMLAGVALMVLILQPRVLYVCLGIVGTTLALGIAMTMRGDWEALLTAQLELLVPIGVLAATRLLAKGPLRDSDVVLGFVTVGLSFAVIENLYSYSDLPVQTLLIRGCMAVPLHGAMGLIHGITINSARRRKASWPLFFGYLFAVACHTGWDLAASLPGHLQEWVLIPVCILMILVSARTWLRVREVEVDDLSYQHAH
jgi:RsiW-degrading membrane proteinase PrsW (M82 family)